MQKREQRGDQKKTDVGVNKAKNTRHDDVEWEAEGHSSESERSKLERIELVDCRNLNRKREGEIDLHARGIEGKGQRLI